MKGPRITGLELYPVATERETGVVNGHILLKVNAEGGQYGWGELSDLSHPPFFAFDVPELHRTLEALLVGHDAFDLAGIEEILLRVYPDEGHVYSNGGLMRFAADVALHDLMGRALGVPVHYLLGGHRRTHIKQNYPIYPCKSEADVERNIGRVRERQVQGFDLIRYYTGHHPDMDERFLQRLAEEFGGAVRVKSLDFTNLYNARDALRLAERLAPYQYDMIESPVRRNDTAGLAEFRRFVRVPVSEHVYNAAHAVQLIEARAVDIVNIAPYLVGGLRAAARLFALCDAHSIETLIGTTQELSVGTAAIAHLGAAMPNLDYPCDTVGPALYREDVVRERVRFEGGSLVVPDGPGIGVEPDMALLEALAHPLSWTQGRLAGKTGDLSQWRRH